MRSNLRKHQGPERKPGEAGLRGGRTDAVGHAVSTTDRAAQRVANAKEEDAGFAGVRSAEQKPSPRKVRSTFRGGLTRPLCGAETRLLAHLR